MTELAIENVTKLRCESCNDKLTPWEIRLCILCDNESEQEFEFDDYLDDE
jgi:hypothetical protein